VFGDMVVEQWTVLAGAVIVLGVAVVGYRAHARAPGGGGTVVGGGSGSRVNRDMTQSRVASITMITCLLNENIISFIFIF
jgi:hypothetical protein